MNMMAVIDMTGDTKSVWNPDNEDEVKAARTTFNSLRAKKYLAYTVTNKGKQGEIIREFDPALGSIIMIPPVVGG